MLNSNSDYPYKFRNGTFPGPYGVYHYDSTPYYYDFKFNSLVGTTWKPFQKDWGETLDYAITKSSFRVYTTPTSASPITQISASIYVAAPSPAATTGDSIATIVSQGMRGYQVFLDGNYIGTKLRGVARR